MDYFRNKTVYTKQPRSEAVEKIGRSLIGVRRVDVNKGDDEEPSYRSRLVAKHFKRKGDDIIFAPTPPLEALRAILMLAATPTIWVPTWAMSLSDENRIQISFVDISRAYFHARVEDGNPLYVELLPEDEDYGKDLCGRLNVHMYGTRPAADGWHTEYSGAMEEYGFKIGKSSACVFHHPEGYLLCSVRGDDFTTVGPKSSLDKFVNFLRTKYELKEAARLGLGPEGDREARVFNRVARWGPEGLEYEADPRQAERLLRSSGSRNARELPLQLSDSLSRPSTRTRRFQRTSSRDFELLLQGATTWPPIEPSVSSRRRRFAGSCLSLQSLASRHPRDWDDIW